MKEFKDVGGEVMKIYGVIHLGAVVISQETSVTNYVVLPETAREIAREILRLVGDGDDPQKSPAPGLHIGDTLAYGGKIFKITSIYTDGVEHHYEIAGRLLTSYDLIAQGYKRVTLVDGGEE